MANPYGLPDNNILTSFLMSGDATDRGNALRTQNMAGQIGILGALQQQALRRKQMEDEALLKQAIATGDIGKVAHLSPATAKQLMDINEARRQQDWFSPANTQRFMVPGAPGKPAETMATGGSFNPEENAPAVAPGPARLDLPSFAEAGVMQNIKGAATLMDRLTQREQARNTLAQNYQLAQERLQRDYDLAAQRGADQRELAQMRIDGQREMRQLAAALRQPQQTPLEAVIGSDGKPVLVPRNEAVGMTPASRGNTPERVIPAPIVRAYTENSTALRKIDSALAEIEKHPNAFGLHRGMGDTVNQRADPEGVTARAIVADIGSLKIHDRSGAAVTAAEFPRLRPFIPNVTDTATTIKKKLAQFRAEYEAVQNDMNSIYGPDQGYKSFPNVGKREDPLGIR